MPANATFERTSTLGLTCAQAPGMRPAPAADMLSANAAGDVAVDDSIVTIRGGRHGTREDRRAHDHRPVFLPAVNKH